MATRDAILAAARALFLQQGPMAVSTDQIRRQAGVSTGSMYHHFPHGKASVIDAIFLDALRRHHDEILSVLDRHTDLAGGIRAGVEHYLAWVATDGVRARLLLSLEDLTATEIEEPLRELAERFASGIQNWLTTATGRDLEMPLDMVFSAWIGPAKEHSRAWLAGRSSVNPEDACEPLVAAAVAGVTALTTP